MNRSQIAMLVAVAVLALGSAFLALKKRAVFTALQGHLMHGRFDEFFTLIDKPFTRMLYPAYNLTYFKLNAYLLKDDTANVNKTLTELLGARTSKRQRVDLVTKAFNIYVGQQDKRRAKELLAEIEGWTDERLAAVQHDCRRTYDILLGKSSAYLDEVSRELEGAEGARRGQLEYLLARQYENKGDTQSAEEHFTRAKQDTLAAAGFTGAGAQAGAGAEADTAAGADEGAARHAEP